MSSPESPTDQKPASPQPKRPAWIAGGVLILVGVVFLLTNVVGISLNNWWALFILIPAIGSLWTAWTIYQKNDRKLTAASTGPLIGGIALLMVTAIFLFNLDWGRVWPVFLIIAGAAVLLGVVRRPR
jgi:hypothetical protein